MKKFAKLFVAAMMASMLLVGCGKEAAEKCFDKVIEL